MNAIELSPRLISLSPRPQITELTHHGKTTFVIRDDLLPGGTKQRALYPFLRDMMEMGVDHFLYASPFSGFAQVALAYVARELQVRCTIVCERDQRFTRRQSHPFSKLAESYGAKIILTESLQEAEEKTIHLAKNPNDYKIPLGLDCPLYKLHLKSALLKAFEAIEETKSPIKTLWIPVGSGTIARTMISILPSSVKLNCVNVNVLPANDARIDCLHSFSNVYYFQAPMSFATQAREIPDIPSNVFYDAKLWAFIKQNGKDGDFWWNVAR